MGTLWDIWGECLLFLASCRDELLSGAELDTKWTAPGEAPQGPRQVSLPEVAPVKRDQETFLPVDGLIPFHSERATAVPLVPRETVNGDFPVSGLCVLLGFKKLKRQRKDPA